MLIKEIKEQNIIYKLLIEFQDSFYTSLGNEEDIKRYAEKLFYNAFVYVCEESDRNVGLLVFYANRGEVSYLTSIVVKTDMQGNGIGETLLKFFIEYSINHSFRKMRLEVKENNLKAVQFYKKHGFVLERKAGYESIYMINDIESSAM